MDASEFQAGLIAVGAEHTNDLWNFEDPDLVADKANQAREKKRLDAVKARAKRAATAAEGPSGLDLPASKKTKAKKTKKKSKNDTKEYPPSKGQVVEFWGGECFYQGTFDKMEVDNEGGDVCFIVDLEDEKEIHQVVLREPNGEESTDWDPVYMRFGDCGEYTIGRTVCHNCNLRKEPDSDDEVCC